MGSRRELMLECPVRKVLQIVQNLDWSFSKKPRSVVTSNTDVKMEPFQRRNRRDLMIFLTPEKEDIEVRENTTSRED